MFRKARGTEVCDERCSMPSPTIGIKLHKERLDQRIGVTFENDVDSNGKRREKADPGFGFGFGAIVAGLHPYGIAVQSGLSIGDVVLSVNDTPIHSSLVCASQLREVEGDIWLTVHRPTEPLLDEQPEQHELRMDDSGPVAIDRPMAQACTPRAIAF